MSAQSICPWTHLSTSARLTISTKVSWFGATAQSASDPEDSSRSSIGECLSSNLTLLVTPQPLPGTTGGLMKKRQHFEKESPLIGHWWLPLCKSKVNNEENHQHSVVHLLSWKVVLYSIKRTNKTLIQYKELSIYYKYGSITSLALHTHFPS